MELRSFPITTRLLRFPVGFVAPLFIVLTCLADKPEHQAQTTPDKDRVNFANGDRLTGRLLSATTDSITFNSDMMGSVILEWKRISEVVVSGEVSSTTTKTIIRRVQPQKPGEKQETQSVAKQISVTKLEDRVYALRLGPMAPIEFSGIEALIHGWGGYLRSDINLVGATQKKAALDPALHATRLSSSKKRETLLDLQADYSDSKKPGASPVIIALYKGDLEQKFWISPRTYLYALGGAYHNTALGLNVVQGYGGGIGWKGHKGDRKQHTLAFAGDARYWKEDVYSPGVSFGSAAFGLQESYEYHFPWPKIGQSAVFTEKILFLPICNHWNAVKSRAFGQIDIPINSRFSFDILEEDDYARNAPPKNKQNYSSTQIGLKYTFGPVAR